MSFEEETKRALRAMAGREQESVMVPAWAFPAVCADLAHRPSPRVRRYQGTAHETIARLEMEAEAHRPYDLTEAERRELDALLAEANGGER